MGYIFQTILNLFLFFSFFSFLRECTHLHMSGGGAESQAGSALPVGLEPINCKIKNWTLNQCATQVSPFFKKKKVFIYFEIDGQKERERESKAGSVMPEQSLPWGSNPQTMRS